MNAQATPCGRWFPDAGTAGRSWRVVAGHYHPAAGRRDRFMQPY